VVKVDLCFVMMDVCVGEVEVCEIIFGIGKWVEIVISSKFFIFVMVVSY